MRALPKKQRDLRWHLDTAVCSQASEEQSAFSPQFFLFLFPFLAGLLRFILTLSLSFYKLTPMCACMHTENRVLYLV